MAITISQSEQVKCVTTISETVKAHSTRAVFLFCFPFCSIPFPYRHCHILMIAMQTTMIKLRCSNFRIKSRILFSIFSKRNDVKEKQSNDMPCWIRSALFHAKHVPLALDFGILMQYIFNFPEESQPNALLGVMFCIEKNRRKSKKISNRSLMIFKRAMGIIPNDNKSSDPFGRCIYPFVLALEWPKT